MKLVGSWLMVPLAERLLKAGSAVRVQGRLEMVGDWVSCTEVGSVVSLCLVFSLAGTGARACGCVYLLPKPRSDDFRTAI